MHTPPDFENYAFVPLKFVLLYTSPSKLENFARVLPRQLTAEFYHLILI